MICSVYLGGAVYFRSPLVGEHARASLCATASLLERNARGGG
jgi:hypothetical protein